MNALFRSTVARDDFQRWLGLGTAPLVICQGEKTTATLLRLEKNSSVDYLYQTAAQDNSISWSNQVLFCGVYDRKNMALYLTKDAANLFMKGQFPFVAGRISASVFVVGVGHSIASFQRVVSTLYRHARFLLSAVIGQGSSISLCGERIPASLTSSYIPTEAVGAVRRSLGIAAVWTGLAVGAVVVGGGCDSFVFALLHRDRTGQGCLTFFQRNGLARLVKIGVMRRVLGEKPRSTISQLLTLVSSAQ